MSVTVKVVHDGLTFEAEANIIPGHPGTGPTYSCGGTPPEPAEMEVEKLCVVSKSGKSYEMSDDELDDGLYDALLEQACEDYSEAKDGD